MGSNQILLNVVEQGQDTPPRTPLNLISPRAGLRVNDDVARPAPAVLRDRALVNRHLQPVGQRLLHSRLRPRAVPVQVGLHNIRVGVVHRRGQGVNPLALVCRNLQCAHAADAPRAVGQACGGGGGAIGVALAGVVEKALGHRVFQGA